MRVIKGDAWSLDYCGESMATSPQMVVYTPDLGVDRLVLALRQVLELV